MTTHWIVEIYEYERGWGNRLDDTLETRLK